MPDGRHIGPWPMTGVKAETWLMRYDESGVCTSPRTRMALLERLQRAPDSPVLLLSHGWNNDFQAAVSLYEHFLQQFEALRDGKLKRGTSPIAVGVIWPSIWLPSDDGPQIAAHPASTRDPFPLERVLAALRAVLPQSVSAARLYELLDADKLSPDETRELAGLIKPALRASNDGAEEAGASVETILRTLRHLQTAFGNDRASFDWDSFGTVDGTTTSEGEQPEAAGLLEYLDPRWALRLASLYVMKDRAGVVGWNGVGPLLRAILEATRGPVYGIGHSFGAKVLLSAMDSPGAPVRKLSAMLLLQPAISHLSFSERVPGRDGPGGYRRVLERVAGCVFSTFSAGDFPLHDVYHHALLRRSDLGDVGIAAAGQPPSAYAALGGYGPRGAGEHLVDPIPGPGTPVAIPNGVRLVGLDGSLEARIAGHGDVTNMYTAWALAELVRHTEGG
ncbi:hypothetical protein ABIF66_002337 [Bradyrhizobium japonicum]